MSSGSDKSDVFLRPAQALIEPNRYISAQDLVAGNYTLAGFLRKRGPINRVPAALRIFAWSQRFVVLHQGCLYSYKSEVDKKPAGAFSLYGYNTVYTAGEILSSEAPWAFKISHMYPEFKTYYFSAASEQDMKEWVKQIKLEMLRANNKFPKRTSADGMSSDEDQRSLNEEEIRSPIYEDSRELVMNKNTPQAPLEDEDSDDDYSDHIPTLPPQVRPRPKTGTPMTPGALAVDLNEILKMKPMKPGPKPKPKPKPMRSQLSESAEKESEETEPKMNGKRADGDSGPKLRLQQGRESPTMPLDQAPVPPKPTPVPPKPTPEKDYWSSIYYTETPEKPAGELIRSLGEDGVFLVRESKEGFKVLVVFADNMPKKYRITNERGKFHIVKDVQFDSLETLIYHYLTNELPVKICLTIPYWQHHNYKE